MHTLPRCHGVYTRSEVASLNAVVGELLVRGAIECILVARWLLWSRMKDKKGGVGGKNKLQVKRHPK